MLKLVLCGIALFGSLGAYAWDGDRFFCRQVISVDKHDWKLVINQEFSIERTDENASLIASALGNPAYEACFKDKNDIVFHNMELVSVRPLPPPPPEYLPPVPRAYPSYPR